MRNEIGTILEEMKNWRLLPKYRFEERLDIFLEPYLPTILKKKYSNEYEYRYIVPQFPIRKNKEKYASRNADFSVLAKNKEGKRKLFLIELKTDMNSLCDENGRKQIEFYQQKMENENFASIIEGIIAIYSKSPEFRKYEELLKIFKDEKYGFVELEKDGKGEVRSQWKFRDEDNKDIDVEFVYIIPRKIEVGKDKAKKRTKELLEKNIKNKNNEQKKIHIITFKEIIDIFNDEPKLKELIKAIGDENK